MSGYLQGQVWFRDVRGSERDVLLALADHAHDDGTEIRPSMDYLAWKVGIGKRQAQRIVSSMRERGALIAVRESTRYEPTHYRMDLDALPLKAPYARPETGMTSTSPLTESRDDSSAESGMTDPAVRGDTQMSPESSKESSKESSREVGQAKVDLPEGFPDDLLPHLRIVFRQLRTLAERDNARAVNPVSLAHVFMASPTKPFVSECHRFMAHWSEPGKRVRNAVQAYSNWIQRAHELAGFERLPEPGTIPDNVVHMPQRESVQRANAWNEFYGPDGAKEGMR